MLITKPNGIHQSIIKQLWQILQKRRICITPPPNIKTTQGSLKFYIWGGVYSSTNKFKLEKNILAPSKLVTFPPHKRTPTHPCTQPCINAHFYTNPSTSQYIPVWPPTTERHESSMRPSDSHRQRNKKLFGPNLSSSSE